MLLGRFAALSNRSQGSTTTAVSHVWALAIAGINGRGKCCSFVMLSEIYWKCVQFYHGTSFFAFIRYQNTVTEFPSVRFLSLA